MIADDHGHLIPAFYTGSDWPVDCSSFNTEGRIFFLPPLCQLRFVTVRAPWTCRFGSGILVWPQGSYNRYIPDKKTVCDWGSYNHSLFETSLKTTGPNRHLNDRPLNPSNPLLSMKASRSMTGLYAFPVELCSSAARPKAIAATWLEIPEVSDVVSSCRWVCLLIVILESVASLLRLEPHLAVCFCQQSLRLKQMRGECQASIVAYSVVAYLDLLLAWFTSTWTSKGAQRLASQCFDSPSSRLFAEINAIERDRSRAERLGSAAGLVSIETGDGFHLSYGVHWHILGEKVWICVQWESEGKSYKAARMARIPQSPLRVNCNICNICNPQTSSNFQRLQRPSSDISTLSRSQQLSALSGDLRFAGQMWLCDFGAPLEVTWYILDHLGAPTATWRDFFVSVRFTRIS